MISKRLISLFGFLVSVWTASTPFCFALSLYSDWESSRENSRRYPLKAVDSRLNKFLGIEFGKTLEEQNIKILGVHELGESYALSRYGSPRTQRAL